MQQNVLVCPILFYYVGEKFTFLLSSTERTRVKITSLLFYAQLAVAKSTRTVQERNEVERRKINDFFSLPLERNRAWTKYFAL